jgi:hypothetical protein
MQRILMASLILSVVVVAGPTQARGLKADIAYVPQVNKMATADLIVTGQVVAIEDQDIKASINPGSPATQMYRIAVVKVTEALKGNSKNNLVRVGFVPTPVQPGQPNPPPPFIKKYPPNFNVQLNVGMEGLFYLKSHHEGKFQQLVPAYGNFVSTQNKDMFDVEVTQIKVAANPMASLKVANAADRGTAAVVLVKMYRQPIFVPGKGSQLQPVDAEESKLILKGLLEAQWPVSPAPINYNTHPAIAFNMLGIGPQDGFQNPGGGVYSQVYADAARAWLQKNWQTYRIQKYVSAAAGAPGSSGVGGTPAPGLGVPVDDGRPVIQPKLSGK